MSPREQLDVRATLDAMAARRSERRAAAKADAGSSRPDRRHVAAARAALRAYAPYAPYSSGPPRGGAGA